MKAGVLFERWLYMSEIINKKFITEIIKFYQDKYRVKEIIFSDSNIDFKKVLIDIYQYNESLKNIALLKEQYKNQHDEIEKIIIQEKIKIAYENIEYTDNTLPLKISLTKNNKLMQLNEAMIFDQYFFHLVLMNKIKNINDNTDSNIYINLLNTKNNINNSLDKCYQYMKENIKSYYDFINAAPNTKKVEIDIAEIK